MGFLVSPSTAAAQIAAALNLPKHTRAFTLRMEAGKVALLEIETFVLTTGTEALATVLKRYRLEELPEADAPLGPGPDSAMDDHSNKPLEAFLFLDARFGMLQPGEGWLVADALLLDAFETIDKARAYFAAKGGDLERSHCGMHYLQRTNDRFTGRP